jgi:hypothetical protein
MEISQQICCSLMATTVVVLTCAITQSAQAANAEPSESELIDAYRQAHDRRDLQAMLQLFCWDGVTPEVRKVTENGVKEMFEDKLLSVKMTTEHPKGRMNRYIKNGVTYGLNLPVLKELVVETPFLPKATPERSYYPVGLKEGHYLISLMAPVPNTATQTPTNSAGPTSHATESAKTARIADAGQHAVLPAKTPLTVRLEQAVGVKTIVTGGTFSAIFSNPVQVNSVTVIPAGAIARGIVTKRGEYSPEMTLTSVIVNGKSHSVRTVSITFNEQISYPADSEVSFDLVWPLELTH